MSTFSEKLNYYISLVSCSASELAALSDTSEATVSRYRQGTRVPAKNSDVVTRLSNALETLAANKGITISAVLIADELNETLTEESYVFSEFAEHFNLLISVLKINVNDLARTLKYDPSYLSRIRTGQRTPVKKIEFIKNTCQYISRKYTSESDIATISELTGLNAAKLSTRTACYEALINWFNVTISDNSEKIEPFLKKLDEFNLDEYIRVIHFDDIKIPTVPFQFPSSRNYYGLTQMKQGELDFFKSTALSKAKEDVFMCSDMPMDDMADDLDFGKKWMFAIAACIKKGLHLNIIHNIDRPFHEMMLGLESWIPIYMTGQVSPYYLKPQENHIYNHLNYVSGAAVLVGDCIDGFHDKGKYYYSNSKEDITFYRQKTNQLLSKALPLMKIFTENDKTAFNNALIKLSKDCGTRRNILSAPPVYTLSEDLLCSILERNNISTDDKNMLSSYIKQQKVQITQFLQTNTIIDEIPVISQKDFSKEPMALSLSGTFYEKELFYTYEEYLSHMELTRCFAKENANYLLQETHTPAFNNIQIQILEDKWVLISKNKTPAIHFLINHPKMVDALQNFTAPVSDI